MFDPPLIGPLGDQSHVSPPNTFSRMRVSLRNCVIHLACRVAPAVISRLPRWLVLGLISALGNLQYFCMGRRYKQIAFANLAVAFGDTLSMKAKRRIVRQSTCNLIRITIDLMWFSRDRERRIKNNVFFDRSYDEWVGHQPAVCVTGHFGNWEILNQGLAIVKNVPLAATYAPPSDPVVLSTLERLRADTQTQFFPRQGAGPKLWNAFHKHRKTVGLLIDQNAQPGRGGGGGFVDFFGLSVPAPLGAARIARNTHTPMFGLFCVPEALGTYRIYARRPDFSSGPPESQSVPTFITQRLMNVIEAEIRLRPELWGWTYRRWDYIPFGDVSFSKFPFYASKVIVPENLIPQSRRANTIDRSTIAAEATRNAA